MSRLVANLSLVVTHQYTTSRESLLPLFDSGLQSRRSLPEATAMDLFIKLHGMLFTKIDLDNFSDVMARFMERLEEDARLDGVSRKATVTQVDWILMASVNIAAVLQYGIQAGVLRKAMSMEGQERRRAHAVAGEEDEEDDHGDQQPEEEIGPQDIVPEITPTYTHALHLAFSVLQFTFDHPTRQQGLNAVLNPYITLFVTFLSTLLRQSHVANIIVDHVPWSGLASFLNTAGLDVREESRLTAGPPLPEDWAARGMEWVGRRVYERGFWKTKIPSRGSGAMAQPTPRSGERFQSEVDVLLANFETSVDISEGVVDEAEGTDMTDGPVAVNQRRWKRVICASGVIAKHVDGFAVGENGVTIEGDLKRRLEEIERVKRDEEEKERARLQARREKERLEELEELDAMASGDEHDVSRVSFDLTVRRIQLMFRNDEVICATCSTPRVEASEQLRRRCGPCRAILCSFSIPTSCFPLSTSSSEWWRAGNGALSSPFPSLRSWTGCQRTLRLSASRRQWLYLTSNRASGRTRFV